MPLVVAPFSRLGGLRIANVFLLDGGPGDRWLVDTGHRLERWRLLRGLREAGIQPSSLTGVLLTHRHSDHAGNAAYLRRAYGLKVMAHRADAEVLAGAAPRPPMARTGTALERLFCAVEDVLPARSPVDRALDDGDSVAGLEVHGVAGHTEGSVFFRHPATGCLLTGDTLLTALPPLTLRHAIVPAHAAYSVDVARAHAALDAFHAAGLAYDHVLAGHGPPLVGDARRRVLEALARRSTPRTG